jgi:uncharacterized protein (DUF1697 family)
VTLRRYAAFLRGVSPMNLKMPVLKACFERCGFTEVKTLLSSGNVTFTARAASEASLERRAEAALNADVGRAFMTFVRSIDALRELLDLDPYAPFRAVPAAKRVVTFVRDGAAASRKIALPVELDGARVLCVRGTEVFSDYVSSPRGPVFMNLLQKTYGDAITTRTWDTVRKVAAERPPAPVPVRRRR